MDWTMDWNMDSFVDLFLSFDHSSKPELKLGPGTSLCTKFGSSVGLGVDPTLALG